MAERPPCPPLPSTSLSTAGRTAASSCPRAPLKAGEFSNESRIPMSNPFGLDWPSRFGNFRPFCLFRSSFEFRGVANLDRQRRVSRSPTGPAHERRIVHSSSLQFSSVQFSSVYASTRGRHDVRRSRRDILEGSRFIGLRLETNGLVHQGGSQLRIVRRASKPQERCCLARQIPTSNHY